MQKHLTDVAVRSLKSETPLRVWDTQTKGFGVSVGGSTKSWIVRLGEKRTVRKLGCYPDLSLADARKRAKALLAVPLETMPAKNVEEAFEEYERTHGMQHHGERMRHETRRLFKRYVLAAFGHKRLSQLTYASLEGILPADRPSEANHLFRSMRAFLNWCIRKEYLAVNPLAAKGQPAKEVARDRVLSADELKALWHTAEDAYGNFWKLLLLTGQRRGQIVALEWEWVTDRQIEFPASAMKAKRPHIVPFGELTAGVIASQPRRGRYVFPSSKGGHMKNAYTAKAVHDEKAEVTGYVHHDLRRTFASMHAQIGTAIHIIEKLLHHTSGTLSGVAGIYNRYSYQAEMAEASHNYEKYLQSVVLAGKS